MAEKLFQNKEYHLFLPNGVKQEYVPGGSFNYDNYPEGKNKASYLGPGTKYKQRVKEGYEGAWDLDKSAKYHDEFYDKFQDDYLRSLSDGALAYRADKIIQEDKKYSKDERDQAKLVKGIMLANEGIHFVKSLKPNNKMEEPTLYNGNAYMLENQGGRCTLALTKKEMDLYHQTGKIVVKPMHKLTINLSVREAQNIAVKLHSGQNAVINVHRGHAVQYEGNSILGTILGVAPLIAQGVNWVINKIRGK